MLVGLIEPYVEIVHPMSSHIVLYIFQCEVPLVNLLLRTDGLLVFFTVAGFIPTIFRIAFCPLADLYCSLFSS